MKKGIMDDGPRTTFHEGLGTELFRYKLNLTYHTGNKGAFCGSWELADEQVAWIRTRNANEGLMGIGLAGPK